MTSAYQKRRDDFAQEMRLATLVVEQAYAVVQQLIQRELRTAQRLQALAAERAGKGNEASETP